MRSGGRPHFRDFGVTIIRPAGGQTSATPIPTRAPPSRRSTHLRSDPKRPASWSLRQEVRREPGVTIEWEITSPTSWRRRSVGGSPTDEHAAAPAMWVSADALIEGLVRRPDAGPTPSPDGAMDWVALVGPMLKSPSVAQEPGLGLQDNRTWAPRLPPWAPWRWVSPAGQPIRFGLRFEASTATDVATAAETARGRPRGHGPDRRPSPEILSMTLGSPGHGAATPGREYRDLPGRRASGSRRPL